MAVTSENRTDVQIQADVLAELKWKPRVQSTEIGVAVKHGVVTLTGFVDSYPKRWAAEEAAHRVRGVKAVANDIEVRLPSDGKRTDADLAAATVRALEWDAFVPVDQLDVTVSNGLGHAERRSGVAVPEKRRRTRGAPLDGRHRRDKPDHGQATARRV
jgi:hypothetical protein